ncbi:MAG: hypothetical protein KDH96_08755, partial [Candidatus Riesia sp.]|nr:hypothetical protein [Candidatus Riesia sp.]
MESQLLTRNEFRESVFERDGYSCVICGKPAADAHHIMERRLFKNGGYIIDNGASLCSKHHLEAEMTTLSCEEIREAAGIDIIVLPDQLYNSQRYDKWGNQILPNGTRLKGELFDDPSVRKILKMGGVLGYFIDIIKYPRTYHLSWSPGVTRDDRIMNDYRIFEGKSVVITEKRDGENTTMYNSRKPHARSLDTDNHPSRKWVVDYWARYFAYQDKIPEGWRVCGENLYAMHSIPYTNLTTYFEMFSIWDENNVCLSWSETEEWSDLLEIDLVPIIYKGVWDMDIINDINEYIEKERDNIEGYVVRLTRSFHFSE